MIRICKDIVLRSSPISLEILNKIHHMFNFTTHIHDLANNKDVSITNQSNLSFNKFSLRTHTCGELTIKDVGTAVRLCGWLEYQRMGKFITLRDAYGSTQFIVLDDRPDLIETIKNLTLESVISIIGKVIPRPDGEQNKKMKTGDIEVSIDSLSILNAASPSIPFCIRNFNKAKEVTQLKYRYISLRYPEIQRNLRIRSSFIAKLREYLINECNFVDVETPTLFRYTPGGAQEFIVPTREPGKFYSLVQSPQQFKQLLMIGGIDRYFQVARCYRDEGGRYDRQPEFTQLDIEMSFTDREGIMNLIENLLIYSWPENVEPIQSPFKCMTYGDAMNLYGTDQPDLRIPYKIQNLTELINCSILEENIEIKCNTDFETCALVFPNKQNNLTRSIKEQFSEIKKSYFPTTKLLQLKVSDDSWRLQLNKLFSVDVTDNIIQKLNPLKEDVIFLAFGSKIDVLKLLGKLRINFTNLLESKNLKIRSSDNEILWIVDFPLFDLQDESCTLATVHHPFTQPHPEDMEYLTMNPTKVRSLHYDLVLNGSEIGGGSVRIHDAQLQKQILKMLSIDELQLTHMLDALSSGAPPHSGIALGLDRLVSLLCKVENIKDVIAFPKTTEGRDLMAGAPISISTELKKLYNIKTIT